MSEILAVFPLQIVAFPGEEVNLHIFEPRYKQLVRDCEEEGITFGIPPYLDGKVQEIGTEMELVEVVNRYPSGELDIRTRGLGLFAIQEFYPQAPDKLYAGARFRRLKNERKSNPGMAAQILERVAELYEVLRVDKEPPRDAKSFHTYEVAHEVGFNLEQEYEFLGLLTEFERQQYMLSHLERILPVVREMETLRQRVQMNGHFKNLQPPDF